MKFSSLDEGLEWDNALAIQHDTIVDVLEKTEQNLSEAVSTIRVLGHTLEAKDIGSAQDVIRKFLREFDAKNSKKTEEELSEG